MGRVLRRISRWCSNRCVCVLPNDALAMVFGCLKHDANHPEAFCLLGKRAQRHSFSNPTKAAEKLAFRASPAQGAKGLSRRFIALKTGQV